MSTTTQKQIKTHSALGFARIRTVFVRYCIATMNNSSAANEVDMAAATRTENLVIGLLYTFTHVPCAFAYLLCLYIMRQHGDLWQSSCIKFMFHMGIGDLLFLACMIVFGVATAANADLPVWLNGLLSNVVQCLGYLVVCAFMIVLVDLFWVWRTFSLSFDRVVALYSAEMKTRLFGSALKVNVSQFAHRFTSRFGWPSAGRTAARGCWRCTRAE